MLPWLQEDAVISPSSADKLPPGWSFHNESYMSQPSWMAEQAGADPHRRVSIGTFMASRTEVLGGISGEVLANSRVGMHSYISTLCSFYVVCMFFTILKIFTTDMEFTLF